MLMLPRWWDHGVVAVLLVVAALAGTTVTPVPWLTVASLGALALAHLTLGRRAIRAEGTPLAYCYAALVVVVTGLACVGSSVAALAQVVAYPVLWLLCSTVRVAIGWNVALAAAVVAGHAVSIHSDPLGSVMTGLLSLVMSVVIGLWITRASDYGLERDVLLTELRESQAAVVALERQAGTDAERERVAREIHDTIAQSLTGLVMVVQRAQGEARTAPERTEQNLEVVAELAQDALREARALVADYAPPAALADSLARVTASFERETGVAVALDGRADGLSREHEVVLLRTVQEALANVRKHSRASHARVQVRVDEGRTSVEIADDGVGPALDAVPGYGLRGLRDRLDLVGGGVTFEALPGRGSVLRAWVPTDVTSAASAITTGNEGP